MCYFLPPRGVDRNLIFEFFWKFSVIDCALKQEGFLTKERIAEADWIRFAKYVEERFATFEYPGFQEAVTKIKRLSLGRQINIDGEFTWEPLEQTLNEPDATYTLRLLSTVRNNLFHGGEYLEGAVSDVAFDREILRAAVIVLDGCCELHPGIRHRVAAAAA
jgi:hypothetical protein